MGMKFINLVEEIKTVRDFKKEPVKQDLVQKMIEAGNEIRGMIQNESVSIVFIENGKEIYNAISGKAGYYGKMIEAPHYLALVSKAYPHYVENSGYIMELVRFKAWELGLGTCWLSIEDPMELKKYLKLKEDEEVTAFIAMGKAYGGIFKSDTSPKSSRKGIEDIVYLENWGKPCSIQHLDILGMTNIFYYTKFAPSWGNKQPWRFIIDGEKVFLAMGKEQEKSMKIDAGIVMLYFQKIAHEEGIVGSWELEIGDTLERKYNIPEDYQLMGYYSI